MELLSNEDLETYCKMVHINLININFKNRFQNEIPVEGCYIVNLESSYIGDGGTHWTGFIIKKKSIVYFDSFGLPIPRLVLQFMRKYDYDKIIYSRDQIQHFDSVLCGYFVLYFLWFFTVLHKNNSNSVTHLLMKHNAIYVQRNQLLNDKIIHKLITKLFQYNLAKNHLFINN